MRTRSRVAAIFLISIVAFLGVGRATVAALAQGALEPTTKVFPAPTPLGPDGKPIEAPKQTEAERAALRQAEEQRQAAQRAEAAAEQRATDDRIAADRRAAEQLAEQQSFNNRIMTAVYVALALIAIAVVARLRKTRQ